MEVFLVRHGIAESEVEAMRNGRRDETRRLTSEGLRETEVVAAALRAKVSAVSRIYHSPYARAQETAEIFSRHFTEAKVERTSGFTPESDPLELAEFLTGLDEPGPVMIVSHDPFLSGALSHLLTGGLRLSCRFERAGIALVEWSGAGSSRLQFMVSPAILL